MILLNNQVLHLKKVETIPIVEIHHLDGNHGVITSSKLQDPFSDSLEDYQEFLASICGFKLNTVAGDGENLVPLLLRVAPKNLKLQSASHNDARMFPS